MAGYHKQLGCERDRTTRRLHRRQ
uniref:Uncharacterized protein n=1 Tax=Arundo donax TaxID=35708 RepID=A0A0A9BDV9_ARUDO